MYRGGPEPGLSPEDEAEVQSENLLTKSYPGHLNRPCLLHNGKLHPFISMEKGHLFLNLIPAYDKNESAKLSPNAQ